MKQCPHRCLHQGKRFGNCSRGEMEELGVLSSLMGASESIVGNFKQRQREDGGGVSARLDIQGYSRVRVWKMMGEWRALPLNID